MFYKISSSFFALLLPRSRWLKGGGLVLGLGLLSVVLTACQAYDGFPTTTPEPTAAPTPTVVPPPTVRPTLPPPPTATPRPTLPTTATKPQKAEILKEGFDAIINNYFLKLESADVYEVALRSMQTGLVQGGIQNAEVPLPNFGRDAAANWNAFLQAYSLVLDKYKGQVTEDILGQLALFGTAQSFQDCQTRFVPPSQADSYLATRIIQQSLIGIGINLQSESQTNGRNVHIIVRPIPGGPAEKAGIKLGDQITAVNGQEVTSKSREDVIRLLQGQTPAERNPGSKITLTIRRNSANQEGNVELIREQVPLPFMERQTLPNGIGYLRFNRFPFMNQTELDANTKQLEGWLNEFNRAGVKGLVLDLRGTGSGDVNRLQTFLSFFISGQELLILSGSRTGQNNTREYGAFPMPSIQQIKATDKPLVVLVDNGTSAEGEVFAYAIQRGKRGTVVGEPTAGCMNSSRPIPLKDNSVVNITIYRVIESVEKPDSLIEAVKPEEAASLDVQQLLQGKDTQLEAAVKILNK